MESSNCNQELEENQKNGVSGEINIIKKKTILPKILVVCGVVFAVVVAFVTLSLFTDSYEQEKALDAYQETYQQIYEEKELVMQGDALAMATTAKIVMDHKDELCLLHTDIEETGDSIYDMDISLYKHTGGKTKLLGQLSLESINNLDSVLWYATEEAMILAKVDGLEDDSEIDRVWGINDVLEFSDYGITVYSLEDDGFKALDKIYFNEHIGVTEEYLDVLALAYNTYGTMNLYNSTWIMGTMSMDVNYNSVLGYNLELGHEGDIVNSTYSGELFYDVIDGMYEEELKKKEDLVTFYVDQSDLDEIAKKYQQSELTYFGIDSFVEDGVKYTVSKVVQEENAEYGMFYTGDDGLYVTADYLYEFKDDYKQKYEVNGYAIDAVNYIGVLDVKGRDNSNLNLVIEEGILSYGEREGITPFESITLPKSIKNIETITMFDGYEFNKEYSNYSTIFDVQKYSHAYDYVYTNFLKYREPEDMIVHTNTDNEAFLAYLQIFEDRKGGEMELFYDESGNLCMLAGFTSDGGNPTSSNGNELIYLDYYIYTFVDGKVKEFQTNISNAHGVAYLDSQSATIKFLTSWFVYDYTKYIRVIDNEVITVLNGINLIESQSQNEEFDAEYSATIDGQENSCKSYEEYISVLKKYRDKNGINDKEDCIEMSLVQSTKKEFYNKYIQALAYKMSTDNLNDEIKKITASTVHTETRSDGSIDVYSAENMIDGNNKTTWAEDLDENKGESFINIELNNSKDINGLKISAGFFKSNDLYYKNNRPKTIMITFDDEDKQMEFVLKDDAYGIAQNINFGNAVNCKNIKITIKDVYVGTHYNDTCISEIAIY